MMMLRRIAATTLCLGMLAGCGLDAESVAEDPLASNTPPESNAAAEAFPSAAAEAQAEAEREAAQTAAWESCRAETEDLHEALQQIDSRLNIGMNAGELSDRLGDAQVEYDRTNFKRMENKCVLNVGLALESALNQYARSLNEWNDCIQEFGCSVEGRVLRKLRKHWREAGQRLRHVDRTLASARAYGKAVDWP